MIKDNSIVEILFNFLSENGLNYQLYEHEPVFTVEEGNHLHAIIPGAHSKNLFLKDKKNAFFLVSILDHKRLDIKTLSKTIGKGGLSFANAVDLKNKLNLLPGSVTPYGLLFDENNEVAFILDNEFLNHETVNFHPMENNMTLSMSVSSFLEFMDKIEHKPEIINIPVIE